MRPIWSGGITFGLIYIPVKLYSATQDIQLDLDFLSKKDLSPIKYSRIDEETGKEVPWKDIVKGYQYRKGDYVVLEPTDFEKAQMTMSQTIDIRYFTKNEQIDPMYFEKPYYLEPDEKSAKTYALLVEALKRSDSVGVSEFVLRNREHLAVLKPHKNMLILNQMRYEAEIKSEDELEVPKNVAFTGQELSMAENLIKQMTEKFDPKDFKDDYIAALKKIINAKIGHVKLPEAKPVKHKTTLPDEVISQLQKSLEVIKAQASK